MNCKKAKLIDLISYLKKKNLKAKKTTPKEVWFCSPFRLEKTPSFKVDTIKNLWYDFSEGCGGTIIDLVMRLNNCSTKEALDIISGGSFSFHQQPKVTSDLKTYSILKVIDLQNELLISYLKKRKINIAFAKRFCFQIHYSFDAKKKYYGVGFMNDVGGLEIRNKFFKGCLGKKAITTIYNHSNTVSLFESWSDFLSYLTLKKEIPHEDFIILNSTALAKNAVELIKNHSQIKTFFDNDEAGNKAQEFLVKNSKKEIIDNRVYYKKHNDLNDFLINLRKKTN